MGLIESVCELIVVFLIIRAVLGIVVFFLESK